jgi:GxxExxY protein
MNAVIYPQESYAIIGACFEVYNEKGCGFLEPIYHECLELEFGMQKIPFVHEPPLPVSYKGVRLQHRYSPDFSCWDKIILELKACEKIVEDHIAQVLNYLNATGFALGLVVNFGHFPRLEYRRVARTRKLKGLHSRTFA